MMVKDSATKTKVFRMMEDDSDIFEVKCHVSSENYRFYLHDINSFEPEQYVTHVEIEILVVDEGGNEESAGVVTLSYFDPPAEVDDLSYMELLDEISGEYSELGAAVCDEYGEIKQCYLDDIFTGIVYLERIFIEPKFRNRGIATTFTCNAKKIVNRILVRQIGLIVLKAYPFQIAKGTATEDAFSKETSRLKKIYRNCGFKTINGTDYMFLQTPRK